MFPQPRAIDINKVRTRFMGALRKKNTASQLKPVQDCPFAGSQRRSSGKLNATSQFVVTSYIRVTSSKNVLSWRAVFAPSWRQSTNKGANRDMCVYFAPYQTQTKYSLPLQLLQATRRSRYMLVDGHVIVMMTHCVLRVYMVILSYNNSFGQVWVRSDRNTSWSYDVIHK